MKKSKKIEKIYNIIKDDCTHRGNKTVSHICFHDWPDRKGCCFPVCPLTETIELWIDK